MEVNSETTPIMYATIHQFPGETGHLYEYNNKDGNPVTEVAYTRINGRITMHAKGNDVPYCHPDASWLQAGQMSYGKKTLVW